MSVLSLLILGQGGGVNQGLPHNGVLIDGHVLIDCPQDVIASLQTLGQSPSDIDTVYLSHFHGDHTFGFPFFILQRWMTTLAGSRPAPLRVFGPRGVARYLTKLTEMALMSDHPAFVWMGQVTTFYEISAGASIDLGHPARVFRLEHVRNTFGFTLLGSSGEALFSYLTDTRWCSSVARELKQKPRFALVDMNGGPSGIHMSYQDIAEKALPITGSHTRYLGTHVSQPLESHHEPITMVRQGDRFAIEG